MKNKPNVVFILADNVGYGDLGPYGGGELRGAPTPRIDQMAREGLLLDQYLVEPACTPSRAALMTGQYSIRNGLSLIIAPGGSGISSRTFTMGEMFKGQATQPRSLVSGTLARSRKAFPRPTASTSSTVFRQTSPGTQLPMSIRLS